MAGRYRQARGLCRQEKTWQYARD